MESALKFEQIHVGDRWTSPTRTVTETDIVNFACMTGDFNRLHVDHEFAAQTPFGRPVAHGLLGLAWVAGLGSHSPLVDTLAFLGIDEWRFLRPVFIGDTLHVVTEVIELRESGRRGGQVHWRRELVNQRGEIVQAGIFRTLVARAQPLRKSTRPTPAAVGSSGGRPKMVS